MYSYIPDLIIKTYDICALSTVKQKFITANSHTSVFMHPNVKITEYIYWLWFEIEAFRSLIYYLLQALFLTPATEKTKTQAQNSSQKLKEKTQPQGGTFLLLRKTPEKTHFYQFIS